MQQTNASATSAVVQPRAPATSWNGEHSLPHGACSAIEKRCGCDCNAISRENWVVSNRGEM